MMAETCDLLIIGGGPAGMAAASQASRLGLKTALLDEQNRLGGQIYRSVADSPLADPHLLGKEYASGRDLVKELRNSTVDYQPNASVFDITPDLWVGFERAGVAKYIRAKRVVIATGALERPFPIPGWTLPGVMTVGAAQILLKSAAIVPGSKAILAGTGPLLYLLAWQLLRAGVTVQAVLDTTPRSNYLRAALPLAAALRSLSPLFKGLGLLSALKRSAIRHITGVTALKAEGSGALGAVSYRVGSKAGRLEGDLLLLHQGVVPNIQLSQALRCDHRWDQAQLCWKPVLNGWGESSQDGISIAGDGAGIGGAVAAEHQGRYAAIVAAWRLGRLDAAARDRLAAPHRKVLHREHALRRFLDTLYRPAEYFRVPTGEETLVCRCEEVTLRQVRDSVALGCSGPNQLKAFVRAGMGPCQGRLCGLTICEAIAKLRRVEPEAVGYYRLRPPIKPITLGALAEMAPPGGDAGTVGGSGSRSPQALAVR